MSVPSAKPLSHPALAAVLGDQGRSSSRFVDLGDSHPSWSVWSNDPQKMQLEAYFPADAETPGIGSQFNMHLTPVLVKQDAGAGDTFLLADDKGGFFLWNENELEMYRFVARDSIPLRLEDVVARVRGETYSNTELVRQFWNPTGRKSKTTG